MMTPVEQCSKYETAACWFVVCICTEASLKKQKEGDKISPTFEKRKTKFEFIGVGCIPRDT